MAELQIHCFSFDISPTVTHLGNYFISSTGRDLFDVLEEALSASAHEKENVFLQ
jgi:hypothetical protein